MRAKFVAEGMILTSGGRFAGYGFYLLKGKPVFVWNLIDLTRVKWEGPEVLAPGKHTLEFDFKHDGLGVGTLAFNNTSGLGRPGTGTLKVDGKAEQTITKEKTLLVILQWDESFDIGPDTLTGVNDVDYKPPFPLTAKLNKLTIQVDRPTLSPADIKKLEAAQAEALDGKPLTRVQPGLHWGWRGPCLRHALRAGLMSEVACSGYDKLGFFRSIGSQKGEPFATDPRIRKILTEAVAVGVASAASKTSSPRPPSSLENLPICPPLPSPVSSPFHTERTKPRFSPFPNIRIVNICLLLMALTKRLESIPNGMSVSVF